MPPADVRAVVGLPRLLFGVFGAMVAWTIHLLLGYALVPYVCGTTREFLFHLLTVAMAGLAGVAGAAAWTARRRLRRSRERGESPGEPWEDAERSGTAGELYGFLAVGGIVISAFFLGLILVEGLPALLAGDPCRFIPTLDSPIIFVPPEGALELLALAGAVSFPAGTARPRRSKPVAPVAVVALLLLPTAAWAHGRGPIGPGEIWTAWNPDPWLILALGTATLLYARGVSRLWRRAGKGRRISRWRALAYLGGIYSLVIALISPLDALGETLFSAHMVQHLLLMVVAAPLLVLGRPAEAYLWALPGDRRRRIARGWAHAGRLRSLGRAATHPVAILLLHVGALWLWHVPALYQAALESRIVHHLEHASFFFTALLFWWALARSKGGRAWPGHGAAILYVFATALQSGALGALITFAPRPWYPAHAGGAAAWSLDLLVDQQLAGVIMWVPVGFVYATAVVALFVAWLRDAERTMDRRERVGWEFALSHPDDGDLDIPRRAP